MILTWWAPAQLLGGSEAETVGAVAEHQEAVAVDALGPFFPSVLALLALVVSLLTTLRPAQRAASTVVAADKNGYT